MAKRTVKARPVSTSSGKTSVRQRWQDAISAPIVGLFWVGCSIFLGICLYTYMDTWSQDQDLIRNASFPDIFSGRIQGVIHPAGPLGAWIAHQCIFNGFGIVTFFWPLLLLLWGINFWIKSRFYSSLRALFYIVITTLLASIILAYLKQGSGPGFPIGGLFGIYSLQKIESVSGSAGTIFVILAFGIILSIIWILPLFRLSIWSTNVFDTNKLPAKAFGESKSAEKENELPVESITSEESITEIPDSFWVHDTEASAIKSDEPEDLIMRTDEDIEVDEIRQDASTQSVELNPERTVIDPVNTKFPVDVSDLSLEVVIHDNKETEISTSATTVEGDEPYDPSLELSRYQFPTLDLLAQHGQDEISVDKNELEQNKNQIIQTLKSFGISIAKISATVGPTVTLYEIVPAEGIRISKIRNLEDDIALSLSALGIRIIAPIPGKGTIGIEVPNLKKQIVYMRTLLSSEKFIHSSFSLPIALGKKIDNENYIVDLATMPHLLMAGATGQGKSVGINAILVSLLYKKHPSQIKFVMVDPKKVELSIYRTIEKHFLAKLPNEEEAIITDTKKVIHTLNALCIEMDNRYDLLKDAGVRNIKEYNEKFIRRRLNPQKGHVYMPFIVLVVDEFADLIMTAGKEVEMPIARLAQLARAVGIHLIIATQRPSVNVITGTIKANFPGRIAFRVSAKVDSRTILDTGGADQLIGRGDMLILHGSDLTRVQCAFVDTPEVERIVDFIGSQAGYPTAFNLPEYEGPDGGDNGTSSAKSLREVDSMFETCARLVVSSGSGSTSMLQRRFNLGYNRAGRIMDQLEAAGIVGPGTGGKPRELLVHTEAELEMILESLAGR